MTKPKATAVRLTPRGRVFLERIQWAMRPDLMRSVHFPTQAIVENALSMFADVAEKKRQIWDPRVLEAKREEALQALELSVLEGTGPLIESVLNAHGVHARVRITAREELGRIRVAVQSERLDGAGEVAFPIDFESAVPASIPGAA